MTRTSASARAVATASCKSAVVSTATASTPNGIGSVVGPETRVTSAPLEYPAAATAYPIRPLDRLVKTRTGSSPSLVGPAVTIIRLPESAPPGARIFRSAAATIASGSVIRPGRSDVPSARGPISGPTTNQPIPRMVSRFFCVAGCANISSFIAGATRTGAVRASSIAVKKSSAIP